MQFLRVAVNRGRDCYRRVSEQRGHNLDRDAIAQPARGSAVTAPMRIEVDPGAPQPENEIVGRLVRPRVPLRLRPEADENHVAGDAAVLLVQVVGIQADQFRAAGNRSAAGLGPRPVRVLPRHDADLALGGRDVLMPEPQDLADPAAALVKNGEEEDTVIWTTTRCSR